MYRLEIEMTSDAKRNRTQMPTSTTTTQEQKRTTPNQKLKCYYLLNTQNGKTVIKMALNAIEYDIFYGGI